MLTNWQGLKGLSCYHVTSVVSHHNSDFRIKLNIIINKQDDFMGYLQPRTFC